jgi:hypothetical protein
MPITIKDAHGGAQPIRRHIASLIGGIVIAIGCFILWFLVASQMANAMPTRPIIVCGALMSFGIGIWIRLGDL